MTRRSDRFHARAASVDITPSEPLPLAGYGDRERPFAKVADRLEANAVVLRRDDTFVVFVSCDLLFVGYSLRARLEALLSDSVPAERLFVSASHTHFAPATDSAMPRLGRTSADYVEGVAQSVATMVRLLLQPAPQQVSVNYRVGSADSAINRRLPVRRLRLGWPPWGLRWEMRPNADAPIDNRIRVLSIDEAAGNPVAVCWSYACHPVCYPEKLHVSADFPGVVREALRSTYGNIPVLFWQGFSGDVRPRSISATDARAFSSFTPEQWRVWSSGLAAHVLAAMRAPVQEVAGTITVARRQLPASDLGLDCGGRDISVHEVMLGNSLTVFGISAEPANAFVERLETVRATGAVIPVGCIDGVPCYLPTDEMVAQGGYEVSGFRRLFGVSGHFRSNAGGRVEREFEIPVSPTVR